MVKIKKILKKIFIKRARVKKRKIPVYKTKIFWEIIGLVIFLLILFYVFVFSSVFQVREVQILGNEKVASEEMLQLIYPKIEQRLIFKTKSLFLINSQNIKNHILDNFFLIDKVNINKKLFHSLIIEIQEREHLAIVCQEQCFKVDEKGIAFEPVNDLSGIVVYLNKEILLGNQIISPAHLKSIHLINSSFENNTDIGSERVTLLENVLEIMTDKNFKVIFSLDNNVEDQILNLDLVLKEKISQEDLVGLEYIDLRFGNKVYFK